MACGVKEVAVFGSASEGFSQKNINCSIEESLKRFQNVFDASKNDSIKIRGLVNVVNSRKCVCLKGGSRHKNRCMTRALSFLIRYFSTYYTLHRSDLTVRAAPLDPRLCLSVT